MRSAHFLASAAVVLVLAACGGGGDGEPASTAGASPGDAAGNAIQRVPGAETKRPLRFGSKNFTEQFILGEIYAQALEAAGFRVRRRLDVGDELASDKALRSGRIDAYPEYTGTALTRFFGFSTAEVPRDPRAAYEATRENYAKRGIVALAPTPFENSFRLGMTTEGAARIGNPRRISDLAEEAGKLRVTGFPECRPRQDCLVGVQRTYGLEFARFVPSERKYEVLDTTEADVAFVFTTDGELAGGEYVVLDDDKQFFPPYNVTVAMREEAMRRLGDAGRAVIEAVQAPLTEEVMQELNARVDVDGQKPAEAARQYLRRAGFVRG